MSTKRILPVFIIWRLVLFIIAIISVFLLKYRDGYEYAHLSFLDGTLDLNSFYLGWANFDGVHYVNIAKNWYVDNGRFLPLYPIIIWTISLFSQNIIVLYTIGMLVSNVCFLGSIYYLSKMIDKAKFFKTFLSLIFFPTSFYFVSLYTESIFLFLSILGFYFASKDKWKVVSIICFLAGISRLVGIFLWMALLLDFCKSTKKKISDYIFILLPPIGLIAYSIYNHLKWNDWLYFVHAHGNLSNSRSVSSIVVFPQTMYRYMKIIFSVPYTQYEWSIALLELLCFVFGLFCIYLLFKQKAKASYIIFALLCFFLPSMSGSFSGLPRYILPIFPFYIALSNIQNIYFQKIYLIVGIILQFLLLGLFYRGYFIA